MDREDGLVFRGVLYVPPRSLILQHQETNIGIYCCRDIYSIVR